MRRKRERKRKRGGESSRIDEISFESDLCEVKNLSADDDEGASLRMIRLII